MFRQALPIQEEVYEVLEEGGEVLGDLAVRLHEGDEEQVGRVGWMGRNHRKGWAGQGVEGGGGEHRLGREPRV